MNFIVESFSGSLTLTGDPEGIPMHPGIQTGDILGGMLGAYAVLAGLISESRKLTFAVGVFPVAN